MSEDIKVDELVNVQVGNTLFRDGGPYGDQSDAIRDEKVNAAREGREPNFDSLIPVQYKLAPKDEVRIQDHTVDSQRANYGADTVYIAEEAPYEKNVRSHKAKSVKLNDSSDPQADSENVAKAALTDTPPAPKSEESKDSDSDLENL